MTVVANGLQGPNRPLGGGVLVGGAAPAGNRSCRLTPVGSGAAGTAGANPLSGLVQQGKLFAAFATEGNTSGAAATGGGTAVQHITAATGAQAQAPPIAPAAPFNATIEGPAYPPSLASPAGYVTQGPTGSSAGKDDVL